ncbi:MAG: Stk1 family PASTA domain-containing Ser/Thr kinase [Ruminococcaceae bacterium]|nr:Stk1 family PASTA domain-containing Ser/Thr kinase [Oscillospiraceae bacterium]
MVFMDKYVGKRLDGRYEIQEIVGIGGMAVVYKAYDNLENKTVAIKILKEEYTKNDEFLRRFKNESKAIAVLSHPNVVKVFDVSFGDLIQYIVMEYIDGITLKEHIEQSGPLSWSEAVHFTLQILRGLQHAHDKGVVHRDIKPQNIMVLPDGVIKVADFGIARFARSEQETITDKAIGSVHYISPEQAKGEKTDEKADIYSVGVMLYEMLTGIRPFQAESAVSVAIMQLQKEPTLPRDINGSIPLGLEQITMHAMQKDTTRRYKSAAEMLCDLEAFKKNPAISFDYDCFVDDSPTKYIDTVGVKVDKKEKPQKEEGSKKNRIIPILFGITITFVLALIILFGWLAVSLGMFNFGGKDKNEEIKLPTFIGMTQDEVLSNTKYKKDYEFEVDSTYNSDYEKGVVCNQKPDPGTYVKSGQKVTITVSMGKKLVSLPDVYKKAEEHAKTQLEDAGFLPKKIKVVYEESADVEKGYIIRTEPYAGAEVATDSEVTLYVSSGAPKNLIKFPKVLGAHRDEVEGILNFNGLKLGEVTEQYSNDYPKGYVCATNPDAKETEQIGKGSTVDIVISKGKIPKAGFTITLPKYQSTDMVEVSLMCDGKTLSGSTGTANFGGESSVTYQFENILVDSIPQTVVVNYYSAAIGNVEMIRIKFTDIKQSGNEYILSYQTVS